MIHIIFSIDPSTEFLYSIVKELEISGLKFELLEVQPDEKSYIDTFDTISKFEKNSVIIFLGHGQPNQLYGGECLDSFPKRPFIKLSEMHIFQEQYLFLLACDSANLIKSSFRLSKIKKCIGFGGLPTSIEEVENDKRLSAEGISEKTIEDFKSEIVYTVSIALKLYNNDFNKLTDYLRLIIDQRIIHAVLIKQDRSLADLLFKMRNEIVLY